MDRLRQLLGSLNDEAPESASVSTRTTAGLETGATLAQFSRARFTSLRVVFTSLRVVFLGER